MKKTTLTIIALSILSVAGHAQGFYFRAGLGYAFPQAGQTMDGTGTPYNGNQTNNTNQTTSFSLKGASFSAGTQGMIGLGYMINEHVGIQLDASIGFLTKKYTAEIDNVSIQGVPSNISFIQQAKTPVMLMPSLVMQSGGDKMNLYVRLGAALPLNSKMTLDQVETNLPGTGQINVVDFTLTVKNSISLGFAGAVGVKYKLDDKTSLWSEVNMLSMSLYIKETDLTGLSENGQSLPLNYVTSPHVVKYTKSGIFDSTQATLPTYSQPFSNIGISIGVSFTFGKHVRNHSSKFSSESGDKPQPYRRR